MHPKIVFFDLDDTLLNSRKEVDSQDRLALWALHRGGARIGYLTSRTERKLTALLQGLPCDFVGSINGAVLRIYEHESVVWEEISGIAWQKGLRLLRACEIVPAEHLSAFFSPYQLWDGQLSLGENRLGLFEDLVNDISPCRFQRIRLYAPKGLPNIDMSFCRVTYEGTDILIEGLGVDKGHAVRSILTYYGLTRDSAACFGDGSADLSMFRACGTSIAPANASLEALQEAADFTCDNDHACVAHWLQKAQGLTIKPTLTGSLGVNDCIYLLKDITGLQAPVPASKKKELLAEGTSAEMILAEDPPVSEEENQLFLDLLDRNCADIAGYVGVLAESILAEKGDFPVLVSLVRGGVVYGTLCRRYYRKIYHRDVPHYAISLIRGFGIDENALELIVRLHGDKAIQFIDGWTGSGFLCSELRKYVSRYNDKHGTHISPELGVLADTSGVCLLSGTRKDIMLPDCCLNATVCGLISSICVAPDLIGPEDYHGAAVWKSLSSTDFSNYFVETISSCLYKQSAKHETDQLNAATSLTEQIMDYFALQSRKKVRLGVGESTRAFFRSEIRCLLVGNRADTKLRYLYKLADDREVPIMDYSLGKYACAAILA